MIQNDLMNPELLHAIKDHESDDIIEHFGIKGMKWGFRKNRSERARVRSARKASKAARKAWNMRYHNRHKMTSTDLRKATERLRMENDFAEQVKRANHIAETRKPSHNRGGFVKALGQAATNSVIDTGIKTFTRDLMMQPDKNEYTPFTKKLLSEGAKLGNKQQKYGQKIKDTIAIFK